MSERSGSDSSNTTTSSSSGATKKTSKSKAKSKQQASVAAPSSPQPPNVLSAPPHPPPMPTIMIETTENQVLEVGMYPIAKHSPVIRKMLYAYCKYPSFVQSVSLVTMKK